MKLSSSDQSVYHADVLEIKKRRTNESCQCMNFLMNMTLVLFVCLSQKVLKDLAFKLQNRLWSWERAAPPRQSTKCTGLRPSESTVDSSLGQDPQFMDLFAISGFQILAAKIIDLQLLRHHADVAPGNLSMNAS